jgi:hypothetical protein
MFTDVLELQITACCVISLVIPKQAFHRSFINHVCIVHHLQNCLTDQFNTNFSDLHSLANQIPALFVPTVIQKHIPHHVIICKKQFCTVNTFKQLPLYPLLVSEVSDNLQMIKLASPVLQIHQLSHQIKFILHCANPQKIIDS